MDFGLSQVELNPRIIYSDSNTWDLLIGGNLYFVDGDSVNRLITIDSAGSVHLLPYAQTIPDVPIDIIRYKDTLFISGYSGLFKFDGFKWINVLKDCIILEMEIYNGELILGGRFKNIISTNDGGLIRYNGVDFFPFNNFDSLVDANYTTVTSIKEFNGKLYIGGNFTSNQHNIHEIVSWDGSAWNNLDGGIQGNTGFEIVNTLEVFQDALYVGGFFLKNNSTLSNNILIWEGSSWKAVGNGIYGQGVNDFVVLNDDLWIGGYLDSVEGMNLDNLVLWNGLNWCSIGLKFCDLIMCLENHFDTLIVGGIFNCIDEDSSFSKLAKIFPDSCSMKCVVPVGINTLLPNGNHDAVTITPNPNDGQFSIKTKLKGAAILSVYSILGNLVHQSRINTETKNTIDIKGIVKNGVYLIILSNDDNYEMQRVVISKL